MNTYTLSRTIEEKIARILAKPNGPNRADQQFIDKWLDEISVQQKRAERLACAEAYPIVTESFLRKRNRIKESVNRLDDYKNKKGNKKKVRHPSKFKRWKGVLCITIFMYKTIRVFYFTN